VGFVRKRPSRTRGPRSPSVAVLDGVRVQLGTSGTFAHATDAWQHADRGAGRCSSPSSGRSCAVSSALV
jgi:hypothetical protein